MRISDWISDVCSSDLVAAVRHGGCFQARKRLPHKAAGRRRPLPRPTFRQTLAPASTLPESCSSACCAKLLHCTSGLNQNVTEGRKTAPTEVRPLCNTRPGNEPPTKPVAVQTVVAVRGSPGFLTVVWSSLCSEF